MDGVGKKVGCMHHYMLAAVTSKPRETLKKHQRSRSGQDLTENHDDEWGQIRADLDAEERGRQVR